MVKIKKTFKILVAILLIALIFAGCTPNTQPNNNNTNTDNENETLNLQEHTSELKKFDSQEELKEYISKVSMQTQKTNYYSRNENMQMDMVASESKGASSPQDDSSPQSATQYSQTNVQVKGVDEADIIKNDGKYIYTISENNLIILDAYPAKDAKILSKIKFNNTPQELFINNNKTIVFTQGNEQIETVSNDNFIPQKSYQSITHIYIYDTSDKENPQLIENYKITGNYYDSRMIEDNVYIISKNYLNYYRDYIGIPQIYQGNTKIATPNIYYFDNPFDSYNFHTIASIDLSKTNSDINAKTFMLGQSNTLYVSKNNIYIAYKKYYSNNKLNTFKEAVLPLLPQETQNKIKPLIENAKYPSDINWEEITNILQNTYNSMQEKQKEDLIEKIEKSTNEHYEKQASQNQKTQIHKINIEDGKIEYETKSEVNGHLLNQFSLDESDNNLRIATTTSYYSREKGRQQYNNVYILDENMKQIGELEELAQDERIYSTRFIGDKLYMVTFKQIDPLFVIDLEDPQNPQVLGELKIPGYSTYLHPYDENHLIGIGHDTKESEWGGVVNNGVKLSLFDISDFNNPKETDNYIIEGRYTDSIALHEHKAFLFDKDKNLLVMPIRKHIESNNQDEYRYRYKYEISAFVFNIDESGFELEGKITHNGNEEGSSHWYYSPSSIQRTLFMDNTLYTISEEKILANNLDENLDLIKEINLGYQKTNNPKPIYYE
jgi:uncharacterized secreted protein with C-terminal beta-propeller domain